jgi:hypothetical protein
MTIKSIMTGIVLYFICNFASAQTFLFQNLPSDQPQFGLRFLRPNFESDIDLSIFSGCYDFTCNFPVNETVNIFGSLPITTVSSKGNDSETGIGNIGLGLQIKQNFSRTDQAYISLGIFLPTASDKKYSIIYMGLYANHYKWHKYIPNLLTLSGNYAYHIIKPAGAIFGIEIGPDLWIPTEAEDEEEFELLGHYGLKVGYQFTNLVIFTELIGLAIITEDVEEASDRFIHAIGFCAQLTQKTVRPAIFYQKYLKKDLDEYVTSVLGLKLDVLL